MVMIPNETIDLVRNTVNIADYIGQFVSLHKQGQNLFGICPFVPENTPSFTVNESKQIFQCFSCGRGGNVFKFAMDHEHLSFPEAVAKVADFAHVPLGVTIESPRRQESAAVTRQKEILKLVTTLCQHVLMGTQGGEAALAYATGRGLTTETLEHFAVGYLPKDRTLLKKFLDSHDVSYAEQRASGLFVEDQEGHLYDRFVDRLMFPLRDVYGDVIGFSGRLLNKAEGTAKYLNSPETTLFNKRDVLFNLDNAQNEFKPNGGAVLFEGFMDVISAYQAGVTTGIASMGTSLTTEQVEIIAHHTKRLTICYDGDAPGQNAAARALSLVAGHPRLDVEVCVLPEGLDPDDYIQKYGAEAFQKQVGHTVTPIGFKLTFLARDRDLTADADKLAYIDAALREVATESDPVARAVYLEQLGGLTGVPTSALEQSLASLPAARPAANPAPASAFEDFGPPPPEEEPAAGGPEPAVAQAAHFSKYEKAQRRLLQMAWADPDLARRLHTQDFQFPTPPYQALFDAWLTYAHGTDEPTVAGFIDQVDTPLVPVVTGIDFNPVPQGPDTVADELIDQIAAGRRVADLQALKQRLNQAQTLGDVALTRQLTREYFNLKKSV
ncbi:DNA primase [Lacticaseibacillus kribbianus]|uniref:DNA primase n=1 Tax=Lacticaseibacillus kribbianus TaxID=2926292 RepID=UPI001CD31A09|nr:DNA primase [Lacticaseibacillus kribbianus]